MQDPKQNSDPDQDKDPKPAEEQDPDPKKIIPDLQHCQKALKNINNSEK